MAIISVICPSCRSVLRAPEERAGKVARCPACKQKMIVPPIAPASEPPLPPMAVVMPVTPQLPVKHNLPAKRKRRDDDDDYDDDYERPRRKRKRRDDDDDYDDDYERPSRHTNSVSVTNIIHAGAGFPHGLHLILTILSCGMWLPIWIFHYILHALLH